MKGAVELNKQLSDFLADRGWSLSNQAARVVLVVLNRFDTFTADDVIAELHGEASPPAIYRTLSRMAEAGILRTVRFNEYYAYVVVVTDH